MILDKTFDSVIMGDHYLSLMTGLTLLNKKHTVLLISDKRIILDSLWGEYLNAFNLEFLRLWGVSEKIAPLKNIHHYRKNIPVRLYVGTKALSLPGTPSDNLRECLRKFPDIFTQESELLLMEDYDFDQAYQEYIKQLTAKAFHESSSKKADKKTEQSFFYKNQVWPLIEGLSLKVYQKYCQLLKAQRDHPFVQFVTLMKALYHKEISWEIQKYESDHLLLCLLSPLFKLDTQSLKKELKKDFKQRGGHYKQSLVHGWQFHKNRLNHIELASFEGVITPHQCYFMGQLTPDFPFNVETDHNPYQEISCIVENPDLSRLTQGERILYSRWDHFGHPLPLIDFSSIESGSLRAHIPLKKDPGFKPSFHHKTLHEFLDHAIRDIAGYSLRGKETKKKYPETTLTPSSWNNQNSKNLQNHKRPALVPSQKPHPLNHLSYWGSLCSPQLGFSRYILDLRSHFS